MRMRGFFGFFGHPICEDKTMRLEYGMLQFIGQVVGGHDRQTGHTPSHFFDGVFPSCCGIDLSIVMIQVWREKEGVVV